MWLINGSIRVCVNKSVTESFSFNSWQWRDLLSVCRKIDKPPILRVYCQQFEQFEHSCTQVCGLSWAFFLCVLVFYGSHQACDNNTHSLSLKSSPWPQCLTNPSTFLVVVMTALCGWESHTDSPSYPKLKQHKCSPSTSIKLPHRV